MKKSAGASVTLEPGTIRVRAGQRQASFATFEDETEALVVDLDSTTHYDPPHEAEEIEVETLRRMTAAIEAFAEGEGLDLEFE